jgi:hypothetical protein
MSGEQRFDWRTASLGERGFYAGFVALLVTGVAACLADLANPGNPDVHAAAEAVYLAAWSVGAAVYGAKLLYDWLARRGRR